MRRARFALVLLLAGCQGQPVTEVELTPEPVTALLIDTFVASAEGRDLTSVFQLLDGHVDIRVNGGTLYALTNIAEADLATATRVCTALIDTVDRMNASPVTTVSIMGESDRTLTTCSP